MAAKAPTPGVGKRKEASAASKTILRITIRDETHAFPTELDFDMRAKVRKQTGGIPFESYWDGEVSFGLDSLQVMWWIARMIDGDAKDRNLLLRTVLETWPADLTEDDISVEEITPDQESDHPES